MTKQLYRMILIAMLVCVSGTGYADESVEGSERRIQQLFEKGEGDVALEEIGKLLLAKKRLSSTLEQTMLLHLLEADKSGYLVGYAEQYGKKETMTAASRTLVAWSAFCRHSMIEMASEYANGVVLKADESPQIKKKLHDVRSYIAANNKNYKKAIQEMLVSETYCPLSVSDEFILARIYMKTGDKDKAVERIQKAQKKYERDYLHNFIAEIGREDFSLLHCEEGFVKTYLFSVDGLFDLGGFLNNEKQEIDKKFEDSLWVTTYVTGARIYDANMASSNQKQASLILKTYNTIGGQGFEFYETAVEVCLQNDRGFEVIVQPFLYISKLYERLDSSSKESALKELRFLLRFYSEKNHETIDKLNLTWFFNTGEWIFSEAFSDYLINRDGRIDKEYYKKNKRARKVKLL